jgi:hypothetical protein
MSNMHSNSTETDQSVITDAEMSVAEYKEWVDALVLRAESLEKARQHTPGKIIRRNSHVELNPAESLKILKS